MKNKKTKNDKFFRNKIITLRVTREEFEFIKKRVSLTNAESLSDYLRQIAISGVIINVNLTELTSLTKSMINISSNINQIARRVNSTGRAYEEDINYLKEVNEKIWQSLKSVQSKLHSL